MNSSDGLPRAGVDVNVGARRLGIPESDQLALIAIERCNYLVWRFIVMVVSSVPTDSSAVRGAGDDVVL